MARLIPPPRTHSLPVFHAGLAAASLLLFSLTVFLCASHSRKVRRWAACYNSGDHEPVIHLNSEMMMMMTTGTESGMYSGDASTMLSGDQRKVPLWQKNILMGGKCQLPDFSGIILYDTQGNSVSPPSTTPRPLLTWK